MQKCNEWIKFDPTIQITNDIKFINCDTRDFACYFSTEENSNTSEIIKHALQEHLVSSEFLLFVLNDIYIKSGGEGDWRYLEMKNGGWLKYIWFTRYDDKHFVITSRDGKKYLNPNKLKEIINWDNEYSTTEKYD